MRVAVVSGIHGNLTALDAAIADLEQVSPDLVVQSGAWPPSRRIRRSVMFGRSGGRLVESGPCGAGRFGWFS